jgi:hypothetical protein
MRIGDVHCVVYPRTSCRTKTVPACPRPSPSTSERKSSSNVEKPVVFDGARQLCPVGVAERLLVSSSPAV